MFNDFFAANRVVTLLAPGEHFGVAPRRGGCQANRRCGRRSGSHPATRATFDGLAPCLVVPAAEVRPGDLIDGWLRVELVGRLDGGRDPDGGTVDVHTVDGLLRLPASTPCLVLRGSVC
ncbi:MAG: hypothetical protein JWM34_2643 [Ilumatobacteraceae bacterium]|nr:hypothetical protein [Ilumatobacteraceae bacterium]